MNVGLEGLLNDDWEQEEPIPQESIGSCIEVLPRRLSLSISESSDDSLELVEKQILPLRPRKRNRSPDETLEEPIHEAQDPIQVHEASNTQEDLENEGRARRRRVVLDYKQLHSTGMRAAH